MRASGGPDGTGESPGQSAPSSSRTPVYRDQSGAYPGGCLLCCGSSRGSQHRNLTAGGFGGKKTPPPHVPLANGDVSQSLTVRV